MKPWSIFRVDENQKPVGQYSMHYSNLRADNQKNREQVLREWKDQMHFSSGQNCLPNCEFIARPYQQNRLDNYGTRRGG